MARRNDHTREELRHMILDAATELLEEEGPSGLSARKIAKEIGYTVGTLYNVFHNLDDIILNINGQTLDELNAAMADAIAYHEEEEPIHDLVRTYVQFFAENFTFWSLVFDHKVADEDLPEWYLPKLDEAFTLLEKGLSPYFEVGDSKGLHQATMIIWAGMYGICALSFAGGTDHQARQMALKLCNAMISNYLRGTSKESGAEPFYQEDTPESQAGMI